MSKPRPELYQNDALDRRRAGMLPVWQIVAGITLRLAAAVTGLFAAPDSSASC